MSNIKHVLIVEDDGDVLEVLQKIFLEEGLEVSTAVNGLDALEKFNEKRPDIIFSDIFMPELDGAQLAIRVKDIAPDLPIVLVSGRFTDLIDMHRAGEFKCDRILYKPFTKWDILQTLSFFNSDDGSNG